MYKLIAIDLDGTLLNSKGYGSAQPNISSNDIENIIVNDITENNLKDIYSKIRELIHNPEMIVEYAEKAKKCCELNHDREKTYSMIEEDFLEIYNKS